MRISNEEVFTTDELLKEFFGMDDKLICNMTEKKRYEYICSYLYLNNADKKDLKKSKYHIFELNRDIYLIPKDIFDENDMLFKR